MATASFAALRARVLAALQDAVPANPDPACVLALSGGGDSVALLRLLAGHTRLRCVHINHGLSPQAKPMQEAATTMAGRCGVDLHCISLRRPPSANIEEWAREERYRRLKEEMHPGEVVITAHHRDDQAETFLLAAVRASGPAGLRGMAASQAFGSGLLLRPALGVGGGELRSVLDPACDVWVDDPANADPRFDRSRLRMQVMPVLQQWQPHAAKNLARSATLLEQIYREQSATLDVLSGCLRTKDPWSWDAKGWMRLPLTARDRLLRAWAREAGAPRVPGALAVELERQLQKCASHRIPSVAWQNWSWRLYDERLFLVPPLPQPPDALPVSRSGVFDWLDGSRVQLLLADSSESGRLMTARTRLRVIDVPERAPRLQQLFRECGIPPWIRSLWPVWVREDGRVCAAGLIPSNGKDVHEIRWLQPPAWATHWLEKAAGQPFR